MRGRLPSLTVAGAIVALTLVPSAQAGTRDLDRTFGIGGIVLTPIAEVDSSASAIAAQPDGKIVAVGNTYRPGFPGTQSTTIRRYLPNGKLDPTFGGGDGLVLESWAPGGSTADAVAVQPDGRIVVSGVLVLGAGEAPFVARYLPNGAEDPDFGGGGLTELPLGNDSATAPGLALQGDGRIVVAGSLFPVPQGTDDKSIAYVARLTAAGSMDATFGADRNGVTELSGEFEIVKGLAIQDGRPVVVGSIWVPDRETFDVMLLRLDANGAFDGTFGDGGIVRDRGGNDDLYFGNDLAVWKGKLLVAGQRGPTVNQPHNYMLARYNGDDGSADESFNPGAVEPGHVFAGAGDGGARADALAVDPATGAATLTGSATVGSKTELMAVRYTSSGARDDATFRSEDGHVGARLVDAGDGGRSVGHDVLLAPGGKVVAAGEALNGGSLNFLLTRFGDTPPPAVNLRPVARIRGHHRVPRKHWVRFHALRSFDRDGRIVDYAWRTGDKPFRSLGPVFWHRFGRVGLHRLQLRVTDDDGLRSVATFYVRVFKRRAS